MLRNKAHILSNYVSHAQQRLKYEKQGTQT